MSARTWLGGLVLLAGSAAVWTVFRPGPLEATPMAFTSSAQCRDCHAEVYREWEASWHAQAWTDPDVRALSNDFANTDCIDCHAPRPVFETGLGNRVLPRSARRAEGVDCIACHALPALAGQPERMAGTIDRLDVPCRPQATLDLSRPEFCAPCHDQHKTVEQWRTTRYAAEGIDCVDCHMPFRGGDPNRGRDHTNHGGHSLELVQQAVELRARRDGSRVLVEIENVGAGHSFPTDERSRAADVFWRPLAQGTPEPWRWLFRFRSPYRDEIGVPDTLLAAHATRTLELELEEPESAGALEVALFFKLTPYWTDPAHPDPERESRLVKRVVVAP